MRLPGGKRPARAWERMAFPSEEIVAKPYDGPIVDAHHHLWDFGLACHPWLAPDLDQKGGLADLAPLRRDYLPADYRRDAARQNVVATIHVEASWQDDDCVG